MHSRHPWQALVERARDGGAAPVVTYYDIASGERMELSAASLLNAASKAAGLLRDELDVQPGDRVGVFLPLHWQMPVWIAACSAVGAVAVMDLAGAPCMVDVVDPRAPGGAAPEAVAAALLPFGLPGRDPLPELGRPTTDQAVAARAHPDVFVPWEPPDADDAFAESHGVTRTAGEVMAWAVEQAAALGLEPGGRLLVAGAVDPLTTLAVPLAAAASAVLVAGDPTVADLDHIRTQERITAG